MNETYVHGFKVKYEDNAHNGLVYLRDHLDLKEAKVFFDQARIKKSAQFEDEYDKNYTLVYNPDRTYTLIRRSY